MHVLHVYKDYAPVVGGIENTIRTLAEAHVQRGGRATVLVTAPGWRSSEASLAGVDVVKAGRLATLASTPLSLELPARLGRLQPDLTHLHVPYPLGELAQQWAGRGRPYVVTYHADVSRPVQRAIMRLYRPWFRRVLRGAARVMVTSPGYAASSPDLAGAGARLSVVPLGADPRRFSPPAGPRPSRPFTLLFVGLLRHYKGLDVLLQAMTSLPRDARLLIAGAGPLRAALQAQAQALELGDRVSFLGRVPDEDLPALYQAADAFVLPALNRAEAFGLVLVEAMLSGLPCVTTEVGSGTSYVVRDGSSGFVVPPGSPQALAQALGRLAADPALGRSLGQSGRARAVTEFTHDRMVAAVEQVYAETLAEAAARGARLAAGPGIR